MPYFLCKVVPPRPTFPAGITPEEVRAMQEHVIYWTDLARQGTAIAFGPVADPTGTYGLGLVEAANEDVVRGLQAADPVIRSGLGFRHELYAMPDLVVASKLATG